MATRKRAGSKRGAPTESERPAIPSPSTISSVQTAAPSKIPEQARFPLLVGASLLSSYLLYTLTAPLTSGDLSTVSARRDKSYEVGFFLAWRVFELGLGWYEGYDTVDQGSLTVLAHLPYLFFLASFYKIRPITTIICLLNDLVAICGPVYLSRGLRGPHRLQPPKNSVANRSLITDIQIQLLTSLFASGVYSVIVFGSFRTWVPQFFVTHFEGIKDISSLYNSEFVLLCAAFLPTGFAAKSFLFTPATAAKPDAYDTELTTFNAETATLAETIRYNIYGHSKRVRVLAHRSLILAAAVGLHTWLHTYLVVDGAEIFGALGWSAIWSLGAIGTGLVFAWVGDVEI